jgi:hypothetical protein
VPQDRQPQQFQVYDTRGRSYLFEDTTRATDRTRTFTVYPQQSIGGDHHRWSDD